ncbi:hypothetical protein HYY75_03295 [bacterium]|nr:hypothetical protein [bacterium]
MLRLPLLFGFFLSVSLSIIVLLLSLIAKVTFQTLIFRTLTVFFVFGVLGTFLGSVLEVFIMPISAKQEKERLESELKLADDSVEQELGDLIKPEGSSIVDALQSNKPTEFKPVAFPRMKVKKGKVVSSGDSAVVS